MKKLILILASSLALVGCKGEIIPTKKLYTPGVMIYNEVTNKTGVTLKCRIEARFTVIAITNYCMVLETESNNIVGWPLFQIKNEDLYTIGE